MRWTIAVVACGIAAFLALFIQALIQSREDAEREEKEEERDSAFLELQKSLIPKLGFSVSNSSNAMTRSVPHSSGTFDSVAFFRTAYISPLQDVGVNSYIAEAERVRPNNKESFYLDILAVGSIQMLYDDLWWLAYRSQIHALTALNQPPGMMPIDEFKKFYDKAAIDFEKDYVRLKITFEDWMKFMQQSLLIIVHPSNMVEITVKGKDFLKYLLHHGRNIDSAKRL